MIDINNDLLLRKILMKHFLTPDHKTANFDTNLAIKHLKSNTCADQLTIQVEIVNKIIKLIKFDGSACVVATSSTDILIDQLINKTIKQAKELLFKYQEFLNSGKLPADFDLDQLVVFKNLYKQKNRIGCASLMIEPLLELFFEYEQN
ncbi:Nitrogen fixation protein NifU [Mycoplasma putrefaciens]|uniref:NIF system FeS cluster assembly NifU N-terminal domain-containing protein n=1 Tax=Mycoplasma putrefaciens (strain ATCC 15718 / NCTC 10155 / C30 KS-1 / KS-1) TaxID=743965 RepID=A0A7U3ZSD4_MYCPK|nr:iron-sulfur cluster assembly scaffold protein [Mycoplasma putrefaciens]AEM68651.1 uncharacterized protein MPUT_0269 [Mycoplasma putrefaciens KS1]SYV95684.1 Nitrogen fixation protein NifU [Mycoplasma putrefaciens]